VTDHVNISLLLGAGAIMPAGARAPEFLIAGTRGHMTNL